MPWREVRVAGRVQGVGFRAFVSNVARKMAATGEVWNEREGGVGIRVHLDTAALLDEFVSRVRNGPGRVDHISVMPDEDGDAAEAFRVGSTR